MHIEVVEKIGDMAFNPAAVIRIDPETLKSTKPIYKTYEDYPIEDLMIYGGVDCLVTSDLLSKLGPKIFEEPLYTWVEQDAYGHQIKRREKIMSIAESYKRYTTEAHEFILDLEMNGMKYDVELNKVLKKRLETEIVELEEVIFAGMGREINLDSGQQLSEYLYQERGFEVSRRTKTGEPSTDGDTVKELATKYPAEKAWLSPLAKRNDLASIYRTFVATYVEDFVKRDGRIHPNYNLQGTSSFRMSGDNPNLTQLPRKKHGYNLREMFTVEKGMVFMAFDYSSAEIKILGALCKDPNMLEAIRLGRDFHAFAASEMYGIDYDTFVKIRKDETHPLHEDYEEKRQISKALGFGIVYGSSPNGVALSMGITKEQAEELISLYFRSFPLLEAYVKCSHEMAKENHYMVTPFGQRKTEYGTMRPFQGTAVYNGCLRNSQNFRCQSTTSTFGMMCFAALNKAVKPLGVKSCCSVYDSLELEVPLNVAAEVLEMAFYYLNDRPVEVFDWLDLPVGVDAEIGTSWNCVKIKRGATQSKIEEMYRNGFKL